jgi:hypothetical protein
MSHSAASTAVTGPARHRHCPHCGSLSTRRSRRNAFDNLLAVVLLAPYRCRQCGERFREFSVPHRTVQEKPARGHRSEAVRRRKARLRRQMMLYGMALLLFMVVVFVITREPN